MKILDIYKENRLNKINENYENDRKTIRDEDGFQAIINKANKEIKELRRSEGYDGDLFSRVDIWDTTQVTKDKLEVIEKEYKIETLKVTNLILEIESMLEMAETYDQKKEILKSYGVIKDNRIV